MNNSAKINLSFAFMLIISVVSFAFLIGSEVGIVRGGIERGYWSGSTWESSSAGAWFRDSSDGAYWSESLGDSRPTGNLNPATQQITTNIAPVQVSTTSQPSSRLLGNYNLGDTEQAESDEIKPKGLFGEDPETPENIPAPPANGKSPTDRGEVSGWIFGNQSFGIGHLLQGVEWAIVVLGAVKTFAPILGMDDEQTNAVSTALSAGIMAGKMSYALLGKGGIKGYGGIFDTSKPGWLSNKMGLKDQSWLGTKTFSIGVGVGVAWLVYNSQYEKESTRTERVDFTCLPWQAPHGGQDCELCNDDTLPCSEYRCKSLGQSCDVINKGTTAERCVNVNPRDVSPPVIKPLEIALTEGLFYSDVKDMPPGAGFKIKSQSTASGCIPPFTPIEFGIYTDEPAQCKIDIEPRGNFSQMATFFGGSNLYKYNHTEYLSLPTVKDLQNSSLQVKNNADISFFMRCRDANGNTNEADYELKICIDPSPDETAPVFLGSSLSSGSCVASNTENATVDFYINEPATCRWDFNDMDYSQMRYNLSCATSVKEINTLQVYTCSALLNGIKREGTNYYVRCLDQPQGVNESKRVPNRQSEVFTLRGSNPLKLNIIKPNETIYGAIRPTPVELYAQTSFGCNSNQAICYYSSTGLEGSYSQFFDTNKADGIHTQRLDLFDGPHTYFVKCIDSGGNLVEGETTFKLDIDPFAPIISRVFEEDEYINLITPRNSDCVFSNDNCDYLFDEGTIMPYANSQLHRAPWDSTKTYYIKCRDEYRSEPVDCSMIVSPQDNFLNLR